MNLLQVEKQAPLIKDNNIKRFKSAFKNDQVFTLPKNLTREEKRQFILSKENFLTGETK